MRRKDCLVRALNPVENQSWSTSAKLPRLRFSCSSQIGGKTSRFLNHASRTLFLIGNDVKNMGRIPCDLANIQVLFSRYLQRRRIARPEQTHRTFHSCSQTRDLTCHCAVGMAEGRDFRNGKGLPRWWTELPMSCCFPWTGLTCGLGVKGYSLDGAERHENAVYSSTTGNRTGSHSMWFGRVRAVQGGRPTRKQRVLRLPLNRRWNGGQ